jgi:regulatory protein
MSELGDRPGDLLPTGPAPVPASDGATGQRAVREPVAEPGGEIAVREPAAEPAGEIAVRELDVGLAADVPAAAGAGAARRREEAFDAAWRFLAHRDRTEAEVRARLERNDVEPELVEEVLAVLLEGGYVDDAAFARRFAEDRRNLDGWGEERVERRLAELGVGREHIRAALADGDHDELAAATALLARRFRVPPDTPRDLERALGFLVRKGYDLELAHDALRRHAAAAVER